MLSFRQFIMEALTSPVAYEWNFRQRGEASASFWIGDKTYEVTFDRHVGTDLDSAERNGITIWQANFRLYNGSSDTEGTFEVTGTRDEFAVFSTVVAIVTEFIRQYNPPILEFHAKEASRRRLYSRLAVAGAALRPGYIGREVQQHDLGDGWFEIAKINLH